MKAIVLNLEEDNIGAVLLGLFVLSPLSVLAVGEPFGLTPGVVVQ